jgi:hypothetical protein
VLPVWLVLPFGLLFLLGAYGLVRGIGWAIRLFNPTDNAFTIPASQAAFRFTLTKPGTYEIGCTRPNQYTHFQLPEVALSVRALPAGEPQWLRPSSWGRVTRTNLSGETTQQIDTFEADAPGEYELLNPNANQFKAGDKLSIMANTGGKTVLLVLLLIASGFATIGGLVLGILAAGGVGR